MKWTPHIQAVLFDMDGTLLDSEHLTDAAVARLLKRAGLDVEMDYTRFHGMTWKRIADTLRQECPTLADRSLETQLQAFFHQGLLDSIPPMIPGAADAVRAAAGRCHTALVTSSDRESAEHVIASLALSTALDCLVCA